jgi:hypothetical protein
MLSQSLSHKMIVVVRLSLVATVELDRPAPTESVEKDCQQAF